MIRLDHLPKHEDIKLYQDDEMFCINTDTMVLGLNLLAYSIKAPVFVPISNTTSFL